MLTCINVKFIFDSVHLGLSSSAKYSPNSRCGPPSCLLAVFAMVLAIISPSSSCSSYSWNECSVHHFSFTMKTTQPRPKVCSVNGALTCRRLHFWRHFLLKLKILPNLVIVNWLWWIMHVLLANQNWGDVLNELQFLFIIVAHYTSYNVHVHAMLAITISKHYWLFFSCIICYKHQFEPWEISILIVKWCFFYQK